MSLSLWVVVVIVIAICTFIFTKTVSNDAANDFKLRDILSNSPDEEENEKPLKSAYLPRGEESEPHQSYEEYEKQTGNIYEEIAKEENNEFETTVHETEPEETEETEEKPDEQCYQEEVYYEKINDDACDVDEDYEEENYCEVKQKPYPKKRSLFDYVKTFWRGITFTIGFLICLYAFFGIISQVETSNDAIIYSIWLLIGVILIK